MNDPVQAKNLSPRQRQILRLIQEGKVNKEVAEELGIGLGTVKQHIVALFKKLKVSNRAMAVSRGRELLHPQAEEKRQDLMVDGLLERRPCVILCLSLAEETPSPATRMMRGELAEIASEHDAVFVARKGSAAELIFGIQQVTEYDLACALKTAATIHKSLLAFNPAAAAQLKGVLLAGFAVASMKRFGGWTGEAIVSSAIAQARDLLTETPTGQMSFSSSIMELLTIFGVSEHHPIRPQMKLCEIHQVQWSGCRPTSPLVGRGKELTAFRRALTNTLQGQGAVLPLRGEMGMGKSRLCEEFAALGLMENGGVEFFRALPASLGGGLYDLRRLEYVTVEGAVKKITTETAVKPVLVLIDDFHLLKDGDREDMLSALIEAEKQGKLVIPAGRRLPTQQEWGFHEIGEMRLRRLSNRGTELLVRQALGEQAKERGGGKLVRDISETASGVPLFAVTLAQQGEARQSSLPLPLQVVINARLHSLRLDRLLLQRIAQRDGGQFLDDLVPEMKEEREQLNRRLQNMVERGILLGEGEKEGFVFTHPLLRRAILSSRVDQYGNS